RMTTAMTTAMNTAMNTEKILLDTDIGSDIDDAVCLAYLLAKPECELLGITTVSGEPEKRAMIAGAICQHAGQEIPIYPGAGDPLLVSQRQPLAQQAAALDKWPHPQDFPRGQAVEFLRTTIRRNPHEITLLTIGPLTNIALLFAADPEIPSLLKRLVLMCGVFTPDLPARPNKLEWNALLDPHATAMVYRAQPPVHRSLGLDVTTHVVMPADQVRTRFSQGLLRPVLDFAEVWFQERPSLTFHDPLAAVATFKPDVCEFQTGTAEIELDAHDLLGQTKWTPGAGYHEIATGVDAAQFFDEFFDVTAGAPTRPA
ncbi:MAG: nucleoside hydrolase, partial [Litorilinea sp.]